MTRSVEYETVTQPTQKRVERHACDKCGKAISPEEMDELYSNELLVILNEYSCASTRFRRDYCTACLEPVWEALCALISAEPDYLGFDRQDEED
jgi:hypothetical protein